MAVLYWMWRRLEPEDWASRLSLALIAAGGLGNTLDRIRLGYVIDWIEIHWKILGWRYYFPNFNVADVAVVSGVLILAWSVALRPEKKENPCSNGS
jgi:signal peptidase II